MCMFVICMLCTEKRKDAGGYTNKSITTMPITTKKRHSTSASSSTSAASNASTSSSTSSAASAASAYGTGNALMIPFMGATSASAAPTSVPPTQISYAGYTPLTATSNMKCNIVQKTVASPAVVFQELPPRYRAWL